MYIKDITLSEFCCDVSTAAEYTVDINTLLGVCGASPVHVHYETDKIIVSNTYPESILLISDKSYINISQIQSIKKHIEDNGKCAYEILCGRLDDFKTTVTITQI